MKLNPYLPQFEENNIRVYALSPSSPAEHSKLKQDNKLDISLITDVQYVFPSDFGFYDEESNFLLRGFMALNPETNQLIVETDYPFGNEAEEILAMMKSMQ